MDTVDSDLILLLVIVSIFPFIFLLLTVPDSYNFEKKK